MSDKKNIEYTDRSQQQATLIYLCRYYKEEGYTQKIQKSSGELGGDNLVNQVVKIMFILTSFRLYEGEKYGINKKYIQDK